MDSPTTPRGAYSSLHGEDDDAVISTEFFSQRGTLAVGDLDIFFRKIYNYWHGHGLWGCLLTSFFNVLTFLFIVLFGAVLYFIDWDGLWAEQPIIAFSQTRLSHPNTIVVAYIVVFSIAWLIFLVRFGFEVKDIIESYLFFSRKLGVPDNEVRAMKWSEVVERLESLQDRYRIAILKEKLDAHDIASRIMRKENFLIAMVNLNDMNLPAPALSDRYSRAGDLDLRLPILGQQPMSKVLEWNMLYLLDFFVGAGRSRDDLPDLSVPAVLPAVTRLLRRRIIILALLNLLLAPFVFVFLLFYLAFRYGEEIHGNPGSMLGSRQWSPLALWKLREFNELPHAFSLRANAAYKPSGIYCTLFPSHVINSVVRFVAFIVSALSVVLLVIGLLDDDVMTKADIFGKNFLWFLTVFGVVLAASRAFVGDEDVGLEPEQAMHDIVRHTHYLPDRWRGKAHTYTVFGEFTALYRYRIVNLLVELMSVVMAPFVLLMAASRLSERMVNFVREYSCSLDGVGTVCQFAAFDFRHVGDRSFGSDVDSTDHKRPSAGGKMEKSFVNFAAQHPRWQPHPQGQTFLTNLMQYQQAHPELVTAAMAGGGSMAQSQAVLMRMGQSMTQSVHSGPVEIGMRSVPPHAVLYPVLDSLYMSNKSQGASSIVSPATPQHHMLNVAPSAPPTPHATYFLGTGQSRILPSNSAVGFAQPGRLPAVDAMTPGVAQVSGGAVVTRAGLGRAQAGAGVGGSTDGLEMTSMGSESNV